MQAGEKLYQDFTIEVTNPGGHSSRPVPDNAIYRLGAALDKDRGASNSRSSSTTTTRGLLREVRRDQGGPKGADMIAAANPAMRPPSRGCQQDPATTRSLRTTCVATQLAGGHAPNALPQRATANVNCRIFPGHAQEEIRAELIGAIGDPGVKVEFAGRARNTRRAAAALEGSLRADRETHRDMWPGVPVIPTMAAGATDGRFLTPAGIPTYGVSGIFDRRRHHQRPRPQRAHPREVADGGPRIPLPAREDVRGRQVAPRQPTNNLS